MKSASRGDAETLRTSAWIPVCRIECAIPNDVIPREPPIGASLREGAWRRPRDLNRRMRHSRPCRVRGFRSLWRRLGSVQTKGQRSGAARDDVLGGMRNQSPEMVSRRNAEARRTAVSLRASASAHRDRMTAYLRARPATLRDRLDHTAQLAVVD